MAKNETIVPGKPEMKANVRQSTLRFFLRPHARENLGSNRSPTDCQF
jgi:hypothetical protein